MNDDIEQKDIQVNIPKDVMARLDKELKEEIDKLTQSVELELNAEELTDNLYLLIQNKNLKKLSVNGEVPDNIIEELNKIKQLEEIVFVDCNENIRSINNDR